jgi:hypothetical protein
MANDGMMGIKIWIASGMSLALLTIQLISMNIARKTRAAIHHAMGGIT